jgi:formylglycine-generating enzyme required for sulfatase activity
MKTLISVFALLIFWPTASAYAATAAKIQTIKLVQGGGGLVPLLSIQSDAGVSNSLQWSSFPGGTNWTVVTNLLIAQTPYSVADPNTASSPMRFYRVQTVVPSVPAGTALIPWSQFVMGDTLGEGESDEVPLHTNSVSSFYMDTNLVTRGLWNEVYEWAITNGYTFDSTVLSKGADHPVVNVSWYDAAKWCNARSEKAGLVPAYYTDSTRSEIYRSEQIDLDSASVKWSAGFRLPTEAEWEKAARGGASGHRYPWQDTVNFFVTRANVVNDPLFGSGPYPHTSPAGFYTANGYGLCDMAGNVWEWCWDWYDGEWYSNPDASLPDTRGPGWGDYRVQRGGSWNDDAGYARCAERSFDAASSAFNYYGFRCARGL